MIVTRINNYNSVATYYDILDYNATKYVPLFSHIPKKTTAAIWECGHQRQLLRVEELSEHGGHLPVAVAQIPGPYGVSNTLTKRGRFINHNESSIIN